MALIAIETQGLHPTTASCLEALQWLQGRAAFGRVAEIGCGSGILSAVAASIWDARVTAGDISEKAVADARAAIGAQGLEEAVTVVRSDGFSHPDFAKNAPYGLIICNLLAELQARMAVDIKKFVESNGYIVLSGLLAWKADDIRQAYTALGFEIIHEISDSTWVTLLMRHRTEINEKPRFTKA